MSRFLSIVAISITFLVLTASAGRGFADFDFKKALKTHFAALWGSGRSVATALAPTLAAEPDATQLLSSLKEVQAKIERARATSETHQPVRLVAVSKSKSIKCLRDAYSVGMRVFGENYVQELREKAAALPADISWHFIGHLQSNKAKELVRDVPSLSVVESVDSSKVADKLNAAVAAFRGSRKLDVFVQVNTGGEEAKSGVNPGAAAVQLCEHITKNCPALQLKGLMTVGMPDFSSRPENFECLRKCRAEVASTLRVAEASLALSMGMSADFERAVAMGATNVRVGGSIFGARPEPNR